MGVLGGLVAVASWGGYLALARAGTVQGLTPPDFLVLRFVTAGLITAPLLVWRRREVAGLGVGRCLVLTLLAGPLFILVGVSGFTFAPLAHGSIIQPSVVTLGGILLGASMLGERLTARRALGGAAVLGGIALVSASTFAAGGELSWVGDICFAAAGALWLAFTVLLRRWRVDPIAVTAIVNGLSTVVVLPLYAATIGFGHLFSMPGGVLVTQAIVQGVLSGAVAVLGFAYAVRYLGASRAALFPALVPATAILIGIPVTGETPTIVQVVGLALSTLGLVVALRSPAPSESKAT